MIHNAETIARALNGKRSGRGWIVPCVTHDDRSPSLSLADGENGRLLVKCFAGCDACDVLAALRRLGLIDGIGAGTTRGFSGQRKAHNTVIGDAPLDWSVRADRIWRATVPIIGTPAETYLRGRRCLIPTCADLRFLPVREL